MEVLTLHFNNGKEYRFYSNKCVWFIKESRIDIIETGCEGITLHIPFTTLEFFTTEATAPENAPDDGIEKVVNR